MKALRKYGCLLLTLLCLTGCGAAPAPSEPTAPAETDPVSTQQPSQTEPVSDTVTPANCDAQLQLIAENAALWIGDTEETAEPYFYAVTDLDQNGRLEIIQSVCQGTGLFTYTKLWEAAPEGTALLPCQFPWEEGSSQPDVITDPDQVYFDEATNTYSYIFRDELRNGAAEHVQSLIALSLADGEVTTTLLGQSHILYEDSNPHPVTTYIDAQGNDIDEAAYHAAVSQTFQGQTPMTARIGWTDADFSAQLATLTDAELLETLKTSWEGFSLTAD